MTFVELLSYIIFAKARNCPVYQVTLETDEDLVTEMKVKYFDTVPAANAMCILKNAYLLQVNLEISGFQLHFCNCFKFFGMGLNGSVI
ncbi:unnamed protein product [Strongylus vulgaris]|uniref:RSE1/DDB1/CPSF1 first beta-propeller domain-containing protein n=1 Tax=Strongylus vulgaris TaxID=40348 RepID=A0A3P7JJE8_STRVU|nr:unnamed protein product [Strongylus vulgaris]